MRRRPVGGTLAFAHLQSSNPTERDDCYATNAGVSLSWAGRSLCVTSKRPPRPPDSSQEGSTSGRSERLLTAFGPHHRSQSTKLVQKLRSWLMPSA